MRHAKKQEIMVHTLKSKLIKTVFEEVQILELLDKDFISTVWNISKTKPKENYTFRKLNKFILIENIVHWKDWCWSWDSNTLAIWCKELTHLKRHAGKDWGQEEKGMTEDEMVGWHHRLNGHGFAWTLGVGDGQGGLVCCSSWSHKELDMTEWLNWTE